MVCFGNEEKDEEIRDSGPDYQRVVRPPPARILVDETPTSGPSSGPTNGDAVYSIIGSPSSLPLNKSPTVPLQRT